MKHNYRPLKELFDVTDVQDLFDDGELAIAERFETIEDAVHCMEIRWETDERRVKTVVWRSGVAKNTNPSDSAVKHS